MRNLGLIVILAGFLTGWSQAKRTNSDNGAPILALPSISLGTISGGGGVGVRCGDKLEMLDLYEAKRAGLKFDLQPRSEAQAVSFVSSRFADHFWNVETIPESAQEAKIAQEIVKPILEGRPFMNWELGRYERVRFANYLPLSNDYGKYQIPSGCHLEQIAYFSDINRRLSIVRAAWDQLDWLSKSALVTHELVYLEYRADGLENLEPHPKPYTSQIARQFVGQLLSDRSLPNDSYGMPPKGHLYICDDSDSFNSNGSDPTSTHFYAFDNLQTGRLNLVFNSIHGRFSTYQMRTDFKSTTLENLLSRASTIRETAPLIFTGANQSTGFTLLLIKNAGGQPTLGLYYSGGGQTYQIGNVQRLRCNKY